MNVEVGLPGRKRLRPPAGDSDLVRTAAAEVAPIVARRLREMDEPDEGHCLMASVIGAHELGKRGLKTLFQAGSCFWRRFGPTVPQSPTVDGMGYSWNLADPFSRALMSQGFMPEFHAWVSVVAADARPGPASRGFFVDFSCHTIPKLIAEKNFTWETFSPPFPFVIDAEEYEAHLAQEGLLPVCIYEVDPVATLTCLFLARCLLVKKVRAGAGELVADLKSVFGGRDLKPTDRVLSPFDAVAIAEKHAADLGLIEA